MTSENRVLLTSALDQVGKALLDFVGGRTGLIHNTSFWTVFSNSLIIEMSGGLLIRRGYERSEADVRHELISPLLKRVAHSMSEIVLPASNPQEQELYRHLSSKAVLKCSCIPQGRSRQ